MPSWDEYFMALARLTASKSKDPSTKVGAVLVDACNRVVSLGYNGFPRAVFDDAALLQDRDAKLALTIHAETNALAFASRSAEGCTCYVWPMPPCAQCAAMLIQSGVKRVVAPAPTPEQAGRWGYSLSLAKWAYRQAGVVFETYGDGDDKTDAGRSAEETPIQLPLPSLL